MLVTINGMFEHGVSVTDLAPTTLWRGSTAGAIPYSWAVGITALREFDNAISTSSNRGCHCTSLHSAESIFWTYLSIIDVPKRRSTARSLITPNETSMHRLSIWRCKKINLSGPNGCLFALLNFTDSRPSMCRAQVGCKNDSSTKFMSVPLSMRDLTICSSGGCMTSMTNIL